MKVRRVYVVTSNPERVPEFERLLQLYGISVCHASPFGYRTKRDGPKALLPLATKLLELQDEKWWTKSVMYEQVLLLCRGTELHADAPGRELVDGEPVTVSGSLTVWYRDAKPEDSASDSKSQSRSVEVVVYRHEMDARIDLSKRQADRTGVFNWDDVVVDLYSGLSYHEKKLMGFKVSPRDMMLSQYLQDFIHYRRRRLCRYNHLEVKRAVDFGDGSLVLDFFRRNPYLFPAELNPPPSSSSSCFLHRAFISVLNQGCFLRAAATRREFIYWLPGLNAGIPLVPKDDAIHEATFQAHDLAHFLLPDLLFTGNTSPLHRRLYIIYRMLSEAITLVFADMLFVEHLRRSGVEYDWSKRKIWPVFQQCGLDPFSEGSVEHFLSVFRSLLEANVSYCLLGEDQRYRELLKSHEEPDCLKVFKEKYMPFFVEDFRWTSANYNSLASREAELQRWWSLAEPIRQVLKQGPGEKHELLTVEEFAERLGAEAGRSGGGGSALVWRAFDDVFRSRLAPIFDGELELERKEVTLFRAFGRYMMGQCILLARFNFLPESKLCHEEILRVLQQARDAGGQLAEAEMLKAREAFEEAYVDLLLERQLITLDDAVTFKEVCPLFDPCFASYDEPLSHYEQLQQVSREILGEVPGTEKPVEDSWVPPPKGAGRKRSGKNGVRLRWVPKQR